MTPPARLADVMPHVVLCCTACQRSWEPKWEEIPTTTGCPWCGGWTFIGRLDEPDPVPSQRNRAPGP